MAKHRLGIIGGGNMGGAIVRGAVRAGVLEAGGIIVAEVDAARRSEFERLGCAVTERAAEAAGDSEQILLAVKPQMFAEVAASIAPIQGETIVISIMAGLQSAKIRQSLRGGRIVRAMPNTPCQIGAGMTGIALGEGARPGDEAVATRLFDALGATVMIDESLMYAVTAVSASGPAYVFALAEAMQAAAERLGFDARTARTLVEQTVMGTGRLLAESGQGAAALRAAVTSPAGTTAAALGVMERREFQETMIEALTAARDRGVELGRS